MGVIQDPEKLDLVMFDAVAWKECSRAEISSLLQLGSFPPAIHA